MSDNNVYDVGVELSADPSKAQSDFKKVAQSVRNTMKDVRKLSETVSNITSSALQTRKSVDNEFKQLSKSFKKQVATMNKEELSLNMGHSETKLGALNSQIETVANKLSELQTSSNDYQNLDAMKAQVNSLNGMYDSLYKSISEGKKLLNGNSLIDDEVVNMTNTLQQMQEQLNKVKSEATPLNREITKLGQIDISQINSQMSMTELKLSDLQKQARMASDQLYYMGKIASLSDSMSGFEKARAIIESFKASTQELKSQLSKIVMDVKNIASPIANHLLYGLDGINPGIKNVLTLAFQEGVYAIQHPIQTIKESIRNLGNAINTSLGTMPDGEWKQSLLGIVNVASVVRRGVVNQFRSIREDLYSIADAIPQPLKNAFSKIPSFASGAMQKIPGIVSVGTKAFTKLMSPITTVTKKIGGFIGKLGSLAKQKFITPGQIGSVNKMNGAFGNLSSKMSSGFSRIMKGMLGLAVGRSIFSFLRSSVNSYMSSNEQLQNSITTLKNSMGQALAPIVQVIINLFNTLLPIVQKVASIIASFTTALFGASAGASNLGAGVASVGDAATDTAEKLGGLAGFDNLNVLQSNDSSSGSASGDSGGAIETPTLNDTLSTQIQAIADKIKSILLKIWEPLKTAWDTYGKGALDAVGRAFGALADLIENILDAGVGKAIENVASIVLLLVTILGKVGAAMFKALSPENNPYIQFLIDKLVEITGKIRDFLEGISQNEALLSALGTALAYVGTALLSIKAVMTIISVIMNANPLTIAIIAVIALVTALVYAYNESETFRNKVNEVFENVKTLFNDIWTTIKEVLTYIWEEVNDVWAMIVEVWDTYGASIVTGVLDAFTNIWEFIKKILGYLKELWEGTLKGLVEKFLDFVGNIVSFGLLIFNDFIMPLVGWLLDVLWPNVEKIFKSIGKIVGGIIDIFSGIITFLTGVFTGDWSKAWEGVKKIFSGIFNSLSGIVSGVWNTITGLFALGGKIFSGVVDGISNVFKTIVNGLISGINRVIAAPFNTVNAILNGIRSISVLGIKPFSGLWSYNPLSVPQLPKLAHGGIVDGATLAMIGEAGQEAVVPLKNNTQGLDLIASKLAERMTYQAPEQQGPLSSATYVINVVLEDGSILAKKVIESMKDYQTRTGKPAF